jgi:hypothetical protein
MLCSGDEPTPVVQMEDEYRAIAILLFIRDRRGEHVV